MAATSSSYHLLNNFFRTPPPPSAFRSFYFRRPFRAVKFLSSVSTSAPPALNFLITASSRHCSDSTTRSRSGCSVSSSCSLDVRVEELTDDSEEPFNDDEEEVVEGSEIENETAVDEEGDRDEVVKLAVVDRSKLPKLTVKEKKELASYAHSLGKKLKVQLVGKSGVTPSLASSFVETLEANELLKIKIHATCPAEVPDVAKQLEDSTGSVVVGQIGRTVILYRPSLSKLKAEEKRRQERKVFVRKNSIFKPAFPIKEGIPRPAEQSFRPNRRGTRGSSRVRTPL